MNEKEKIEFLRKYFETEDETKTALRFIDVFHGKILVNKEHLTGKDILLLSIYMLCNEQKKSSVKKEKVRDLFHQLNESQDQKNPPQYFNVYVDKNKELGFITKPNDSLELTSAGYKKIKELLGGEFGLKTFIIKSGETFTSKLKFRDLIIGNKTIKLCDPYVYINTLGYFTDINEQVEIKILTQNIGKKSIDEATFKTHLNDFRKQYTNIDIKVARINNKALHDRFLITDNTVYSVGSSIKDLGNKDTIIVELPNDVKDALNDLFEIRWQGATKL